MAGAKTGVDIENGGGKCVLDILGGFHVGLGIVVVVSENGVGGPVVSCGNDRAPIARSVHGFAGNG